MTVCLTLHFLVELVLTLPTKPPVIGHCTFPFTRILHSKSPVIEKSCLIKGVALLYRLVICKDVANIDCDRVVIFYFITCYCILTPDAVSRSSRTSSELDHSFAAVTYVVGT